MTVGNAISGIERSGPFCVRLQIQSATTTQKQIREFLSDLTIPEGGISIHGNFSFVVFDNEKDAALALSKNYELLDGKHVRISKVVLKDVQRVRVKEARKKLVFCLPEQSNLKLKPTLTKQKKRIRPTKVKDSSEVVASKRFCPDEIEYPTKNHVASLIDLKADELKITTKDLTENELMLHDDIVDGKEQQPNALIEPVPKRELGQHDKVAKHAKTGALIRSNIDKNEIHLKSFEGNVSAQRNTCRFLEEKIPKNKDEISFTDENHSAKVKLEEKVIGQAGSSKKVRDVTNKFPTKKTIKPTSVLTMNLFKMSYEGTVF